MNSARLTRPERRVIPAADCRFDCWVDEDGCSGCAAGFGGDFRGETEGVDSAGYDSVASCSISSSK
eukprot:2432876-Rhodomonas_salina.3